MITLYKTESCAPCAQVKKYLDHKGIEYITKDADNEHNAQILINLTGQRIVPTLQKGNQVVVGLNWSQIAKLVSDD